jgi:hypothetical protein
MKKEIVLFLVVLSAFFICSCANENNKDARFSLKLPKNWHSAGKLETDSMMNEFFPKLADDVTQMVFLYTNGSHGKILIVASPELSKEKIKELKATSDYTSNVKIGKENWYREKDEKKDTVLVRKYRAIGKKHTYNMVVVADRINNNFDTVYAQEDEILNSLKYR